MASSQSSDSSERSPDELAAEKLPRPAALWKHMTEAQRQEAARAFWVDHDSAMEQLEIYALLARRLNFRLKSVQALPLERKVKHLMAMGNVSDGVAGRLLVAYHLACQRPMMGAFLDALGIPHEDGLIAEGETTKPDADTLKSAAATLRTSRAIEDVNLYFSTLVLQDADTWGGLLDELPAPGSDQTPPPPEPKASTQKSKSTQKSTRK